MLKDSLEGYGYFLRETLRRITITYPQHEFIFLFDRPFDEQFIFSTNVKGVVVGLPARHPLLWKLWYDIKIPAALKKYKADVFVSTDGFCSLATKLPQCLVLHDLAFLHFPEYLSKSGSLYYKRYTPKFLKKAGVVATVSEFSKQDIIKQYGLAAEKIRIIPYAARETFDPIDEEKKQLTREKYSEGKNYFVYAGSIHPRKNLINLLKAFSVFKKKQKSNMKLLIVGRLARKYNSFTESLKTYKYRDDVIVTGYLPESELVNVVGSAYAMVYPSLWEGFGVPVLEAMRCEIPVITSTNSAMQEIAGDAALFADPNDFNEIAEKMMLLYKDEDLRHRLTKKGKLCEEKYSWDSSAQQLWACIEEAVG
ncbi:MAG TPA: glycosyltransferase family 1 protein [Chitinophagaceae bacterium]